jgi:hypothetical protein
MTISSELESVSNTVIMVCKDKKEIIRIKNLSVLVGIPTGCFTNKNHNCYYLSGLMDQTAERGEREGV